MLAVGKADAPPVPAAGRWLGRTARRRRLCGVIEILDVAVFSKPVEHPFSFQTKLY